MSLNLQACTFWLLKMFMTNNIKIISVMKIVNKLKYIQQKILLNNQMYFKYIL
jgi:hypothetical protein